MWGAALILITIASCNAELNSIKTVDRDNRIIGGSPTTIEKYPFAVQLENWPYTDVWEKMFFNYNVKFGFWGKLMPTTEPFTVIYKGHFLCGGSLVTARHVLSAAHCFYAKNLRMRQRGWSIRAGSTTLYSGGSVHFITAIKIHELYNHTTNNNDVAVVVMATPIDLTTSVARPAVIPIQDSLVPDNSSVTAVGWGRTDEDVAGSSPVLNEVTVRKINLNTCRDRYNLYPMWNTIVTNNMICAGILDVGGKGMCLGDSGGPLIYNGTVVGVTSWSVGCAAPKYPTVCARVASYTNWINNIIDNYSGNTSSLGNKVGAITLHTSLLYFVLNIQRLDVTS